MKTNQISLRLVCESKNLRLILLIGAKLVMLITTVVSAIFYPTMLSAEVTGLTKAQDSLVLIISRSIKGMGWGNGFAIGDGSLIVTAHHVVIEDSDEHELVGLISVVSPYIGEVADAEIVVADKQLDLAVLKVSWVGHPALTLAGKSQILPAENMDIIGMPNVISSYASQSTEPVDQNFDVQRERLPVDFVAIRQEKLRFISFVKSGQLKKGWSGSPILLPNSSIATGCFTTVTWNKSAKELSVDKLRAVSRLTFARGPAITVVRDLVKESDEINSLIPTQTQIYRARDGEDVFMLIVQVYSHLTNHRFSEAFDISQELIRLRPNNFIGYSLAGSCAEQLGRYSQAEEFHQQSLCRKPDGTILRFVYAQFLAGQGRSDEALELYEQIWRSGMSRSAIALNLCNIYLEQGEFSRGIEILRETLKDTPHNAYLWHLLGSLQAQSGKKDEGIMSLTKAVELLPEIGPIRGVLAHTLEKAGRLKEAEKHFRELIKIEPDNPVVHMWLAKFLSQHRPSAKEEALKEAQIALDLPVRRGLSRNMIEQFIEGLHSKSKQETPEADKTDAGMDETIARENVSSFIECDLPKSAKDIKFYSEGNFGIGIVLIKFDIPLPELKSLLKKSDKLPDFALLKKDLHIKKRIEDHKTSKVDWWKPAELKDAVYGGWTKSEKASQDPNNRVWFVRILQICSSEIKSGLIRVYISYYDGD